MIFCPFDSFMQFFHFAGGIFSFFHFVLICLFSQRRFSFPALYIAMNHTEITRDFGIGITRYHNTKTTQKTHKSIDIYTFNPYNVKQIT